MDKIHPSFGFIGYPISLDLLCILEPGFRGVPIDLTKKVMEWTRPFMASKIAGVRSITGKQLEGFFLMCMLLPEHFFELDHNELLRRIISAGHEAERLGAKIIGLGGLTAVLGRQGNIIAKNLNIAVTTGNSYTAMVTVEVVLKAAELMEVQLQDSAVAVIGGTGAIGTICSHMLANKARSLTIMARNKRRLDLLANELKKEGSAEISVSTSAKDAIKAADIIVCATTAPYEIIDALDLKKGAIVCDVSVPRNVSPLHVSHRPDVLIIDGGIVEPPGDFQIGFNMGLPPKAAYACLCETMILALEERYENYTLGPGIDLQKAKDIAVLANKHGFKIASFKSFGNELGPQALKNIKYNMELVRERK